MQDFQEVPYAGKLSGLKLVGYVGMSGRSIYTYYTNLMTNKYVINIISS